MNDGTAPEEPGPALVPLDRPPGRTQWAFSHAGRSYAVFDVDGELHVTDGACPHNGGPLDEGLVRDGYVTCPWHWYSYELGTGRCRTAAGYELRRYPVVLVGGRPHACLPAPSPSRSWSQILRAHARQGRPYPARACPAGQAVERVRDVTWRQCVGPRGELDVAAAAAGLRQARQAGRTFDVLLSDEISLSLEDAYRVQDQVTALRLAAGERRAGWKLGYTSAVMRAQMGIDAPNFGPLTDVMLLDSPALLPGGALQPRVEPEIGLRLGRRLTAPCSVDQALDACDAALACLEIVDSVWSGYRFTIEDNTADGSSAAWVAVGPSLPMDDLASLPVALSVDGEAVERATGAAASGHPAAGLAWLAGQLTARGQALEPGDLVITGGLTSARPLQAGHRISAAFGVSGFSVDVRR